MNSTFVFKHLGWCPICETDVEFVALNEWFRDHLNCPLCHSIPRERALMHCIREFYPNWRELEIHEMAPVGRGASVKLAEAPNYRSSQFDPTLQPGELSPQGWVNQDAENQSFESESFDLVVTQDVFEHIFDIDAAFQEISRTLRPGGAHIFTTPLVNKVRRTEERAIREADGSVRHLAEPEYHGNPVDERGSLVTWHFGFDLALRILDRAKMPTVIVSIDRLDLGIRAEYIEVLVSVKPNASVGFGS